MPGDHAVPYHSKTTRPSSKKDTIKDLPLVDTAGDDAVLAWEYAKTGTYTIDVDPRPVRVPLTVPQAAEQFLFRNAVGSDGTNHLAPR